MGFVWPFGHRGLLLGRHALREVGRIGHGGLPPACAWPLAAVLSHLSNSAWLIVESPTLATAPVGTSLPQPANGGDAETGQREGGEDPEEA